MSKIIREISHAFGFTGSEELAELTKHVAENPEQKYLLEQYLNHIQFRENLIIIGVFSSIILAIILGNLVKWKMAKFRAKIEKIEGRKL